MGGVRGNSWMKGLEVLFEEIVNYPNKLGRGDNCQFDFEREIRDAISTNQSVNSNKYKMLSLLESEMSGNGKGLCDQTRLVQCSSENGKCECFDDTEPRKTTLGGIEYESDYCYKTSGSRHI